MFCVAASIIAQMIMKGKGPVQYNLNTFEFHEEFEILSSLLTHRPYDLVFFYANDFF